jgi:hypothetical protein
MMRWTLLLSLVLPALLAQENAADAVSYRAEFLIRDGSDAAAKAGRRYTMLVDSTGRGQIRVGLRVPYVTGSFQPGAAEPGLKPLVSTQYSYMDTGVMIECRLRDLKSRVGVQAEIDVSGAVEHPKPEGANQAPAPTISSVRMNLASIVPPGKPTLIGSFNDPVTNRRFDVEVTVTPVP